MQTTTHSTWRGPAQRRLDKAGEDAVIELLAQPTGLRGIGSKLGVSATALLAWLRSDPVRSARARSTREMVASQFAQQAIDALREATTLVEIKRARLVAQECRWQAAVIAPWAYGTVPERRREPTLIDGLRQLEEQRRKQAAPQASSGT